MPGVRGSGGLVALMAVFAGGVMWYGPLRVFRIDR
jgi:hypothetical protein